MTSSLRRALFILPIWTICVLWMWTWWITSANVRFMPLFIPLSLALFYEFVLLPSVFLYFVIKAKIPKKRIAPKGKKVAVISLCVPSTESIEIVENQLRAMAAIEYPHDSWILDEGNSREIKRLAKKYGVKHFSRKGIKKYNQPIPPFQEKTKAGNVNAWLNFVKTRKYDFFVQLDIDHIPHANYLNKTLGYFRDPKVGWVQAPSVYKNLDNWTARGAAEQELVLQGPLQMGFYGYSETPFIIGSHCTYRMSAIEEIGGFQPTRAEDHLDTVYLAHKGYKGVFLPEIIAEGDGPETLTTYFAQQFAWAYSMFQVLLMHTPKTIQAMTMKRKFQFLFAQTWYPLWSLSYLVMFSAPLFALAFNREVASSNPGTMALHFIPAYLCTFLVWWSARPIMQPSKLRLSWRGILLHAVRWPVIFRAIIAASFRIKKPYMITPKGGFVETAPTLATYRTFLMLGLTSTSGVILAIAARHGNVPKAQIIYSLINAVFMLSICLVDMGLKLQSARPKIAEFRKYWLKPAFATFVLAVFLTMSTLVTANTIHEQIVSAQKQNIQTTLARPVNYSMSNDELIEQIKLTPKQQGDHPTLGIYNSNSTNAKSTKSYVQHSFVDWRDNHYFDYVLADSLQKNNTPLITLEPRGEADGNKLLSDISNGTYDSQLDQLVKASSATDNTIYIRFGHEMELANLYPWGDKDPTLYINAYQHVVDRFKNNGANNVKFVWSPAGNKGAEDYYPGDKYVDVIGTTILYDEYWYGSYLPSFTELSSGRLWLRQYQKPVWIVEFGVGKANRVNQKILIDQAIKEFQPLGFNTLVYLNMTDANINGPDYKLNDVNDFGSFFSEQ
jgi:cellulose synthase (UDP-forming)